MSGLPCVSQLSQSFGLLAQYFCGEILNPILKLDQECLLNVSGELEIFSGKVSIMLPVQFEEKWCDLDKGEQ